MLFQLWFSRLESTGWPSPTNAENFLIEKQSVRIAPKRFRLGKSLTPKKSWPLPRDPAAAVHSPHVFKKKKKNTFSPVIIIKKKEKMNDLLFKGKGDPLAKKKKPHLYGGPASCKGNKRKSSFFSLLPAQEKLSPSQRKPCLWFRTAYAKQVGRSIKSLKTFAFHFLTFCAAAALMAVETLNGMPYNDKQQPRNGIFFSRDVLEQKVFILFF